MFGQVAGNPTDADALAATAAYRAARADIVVAVGGGSAIDIGKIVRLLATHPSRSRSTTTPRAAARRSRPHCRR